jgi:hypothetical protein
VTEGSSNLRPIKRLQTVRLMSPIPQHKRYVLGVEDGVGGVKSSLVLGGISDQTLLVGEGNEGRSNTVTLLVGDCKRIESIFASKWR